jgi:carbamoyl-phosphate synthase large subunit
MSRLRIVVHMGAVLAGTALGFVLLQHSVRVGETWLSAAIARAVDPHRVTVLQRTSILVTPAHRPAFLAIVTPSCSSAASMCSIVCLATLVRGVSTTRRVLATTAAVVTVVAGNILRISGAILIGLAAGRASLVLFHDWVGSVFSFSYTLGGFILLLYLILPDLRHVPAPPADALVG